MRWRKTTDVDVDEKKSKVNGLINFTIRIVKASMGYSIFYIVKQFKLSKIKSKEEERGKSFGNKLKNQPTYNQMVNSG